VRRQLPGHADHRAEAKLGDHFEVTRPHERQQPSLGWAHRMCTDFTSQKSL